jgi:hypothetical protein
VELDRMAERMRAQGYPEPTAEQQAAALVEFEAMMAGMRA